MIDSIWKAGAKKEKAEDANRMVNPKAKPGSTTSIPSNKVQLSRNRDKNVTSSRLAKMWATLWKTKPQPILAVETHVRGLKRKLFNSVG